MNFHLCILFGAARQFLEWWDEKKAFSKMIYWDSFWRENSHSSRILKSNYYPYQYCLLKISYQDEYLFLHSFWVVAPLSYPIFKRGWCSYWGAYVKSYTGGIIWRTKYWKINFSYVINKHKDPYRFSRLNAFGRIKAKAFLEITR